MSYKTNVEYTDMPISKFQDDNYGKHALWDATLIDSDAMGGYNRIFSTQNVEMIGEEVTKLLKGVDPTGRDIVFPSDKIVHVLNQLYESQKGKNIGDIFSRFHISGTEQRDEVLEINSQAINLISNDIRNTLEMTQCNEKLDKFKTILGDFNTLGLRSHSKIYTRQRKPNTMEFHMRF